MNGYPARYTGLDGIVAIATYKPQSGTAVSRVAIAREDGQPIEHRGCKYPQGIIGGYGDLFAENFLLTIAPHRLDTSHRLQHTSPEETRQALYAKHGKSAPT